MFVARLSCRRSAVREATVALGATIREVTSRLADVTVSSMSEGATPSRSDAKLTLYAVSLKLSTVAATSATNVTTAR